MSLSFSKVAFRDVDQFSEWETSLGWNITSTQLSLGTNQIGFDHFALPDLLVSHFHVRQSTEDVFELPDGMVLLLICRARQPVFWSGMEIPPSLLPVVHPRRTHWVVLPPNWDCYEFIVSEELVRRTELFPPEFFERTTRLEHASVPVAEPQTGWFLERMDSLFRGVRNARGSLEAALSEAEFYDFVLSGLRQVIDSGLAARGSQAPRPARRADLVPKAREFMAANMAKELTADQIARALGVSYRLLHYAFGDTVGVSPYRYFLTGRLHAARRYLRSGRGSVTEACTAHGFTVPSRFSRQYKRLFGELPSETLINK
jgi:AraC-like DNA-binding protein